MQRSSRKIWGVSLLVSGVLVASCSTIEPLRALIELKDALKNRDESKVAALVDFPKVRANNEALTLSRLQHDNEDRPLGGLRTALVDKFVDRAIDKIATPSGMIAMVCDGSLKPTATPPPPCELKGKLLERHSISDTRYAATLETKDGKQFVLTVEKEPDAVWRVVDMAMSAESFEKVRKSLAP